MAINSSMWGTKRKKPYTKVGIARVPCIRCGGKAEYQWQICADGNNYRPLCTECDVALNREVLRWMRHPREEELSLKYSLSRRGGRGDGS